MNCVTQTSSPCIIWLRVKLFFLIIWQFFSNIFFWGKWSEKSFIPDREWVKSLNWLKCIAFLTKTKKKWSNDELQLNVNKLKKSTFPFPLLLFPSAKKKTLQKHWRCPNNHATFHFHAFPDNIFEYLRAHLAKGQQAISLEGQRETVSLGRMARELYISSCSGDAFLAW